MAKVVYVNGATGSNLNSGLTPALAKATILGARAATAAGDRVSIATGVYLEADVTFNAAGDVNVLYMHDGSGPVIVDFANRATAGQHWLTSVLIQFVGIQFRNPGAATLCISAFSVAARVVALNCVFYQKAGAANTGHGIQRAEVINCSFHNLNTAIGVSSLVFGCYMVSCTTPHASVSARDYNAFPGNTEPNGINTSTGANPGFRSPDDDDFRLDQGASADFQAFMTGGVARGRIAATGTTGPFYYSRFPQTRMFTPDPIPGAFAPWENDTSYVATGTLGTVVQDPTTAELQFDLATTPTATDGRIRSDVFVAPTGKVFRFTGISIERFEDRPFGSILDINTTLPAKWEYRSSNTAFSMANASPGWLAIEQSSILNLINKYIQFRITFRTDHPNV